MNYFAHARLAAIRCDDPRFVLGAMLPDWTGWMGDRLARVDQPALAAGLRFHHASDAAFHGGARFAELMRDSAAWLRDTGLGRGPARAAAHVGIELLLDGALLGSGAGRRAYVAALAAAPAAARHLAWRRPGSSARFAWTARRLLREGLPGGLDDAPDRIARRIARILARRPRLRIDADRESAVEDWAREARRTVRRDAGRLLAETEARLSWGDLA